MKSFYAVISAVVVLFAAVSMQACGACSETSLGGDTFMDGYEPPEPGQDPIQDPVQDPDVIVPSMTTWARTYGTGNDQQAFSMALTPDGGYIVVGDTGEQYSRAIDLWVVKLDMEGIVQWQKSYGGPEADRAAFVIPTSDGGYAVSGSTESFGAGASDLLLLKLDANGNVAWQKAYGGEGDETNALGVRQTTDGGYVLAGLSYAFWLMWVVKLDGGGQVQWQKGYTVEPLVEGGAFVITAEGDIVLALDYFGSDPARYVLVRLDPAGSVLWSRAVTAWTGNPQGPAAIQTTADGDLLFAGTWTAGSGFAWCWVMRLDPDGQIRWSRTYARDSWDVYQATAIESTEGGGVIVAGSGPWGGGRNSFWLFELDGSGGFLWGKAYGSNLWDRQGGTSRSVHQTSDHGFIVAGDTDAYGAGGLDFWVIKTDSEGNIHGACPENMGTITEIVMTQDMPTISDATLTGEDTDGGVTVTTITPVDTAAPTALQCGG